MDVLFNHVYAHAVEFSKLAEEFTKGLGTSESVSPEISEKFDDYAISGYAAITATLNERLTPAFHIQTKDRDVGNVQFLSTASFSHMSGYFDKYPDLDKTMDAELAQNRNIKDKLSQVRTKIQDTKSETKQPVENVSRPSQGKSNSPMNMPKSSKSDTYSY